MSLSSTVLIIFKIPSVKEIACLEEQHTTYLSISCQVRTS